MKENEILNKNSNDVQQRNIMSHHEHMKDKFVEIIMTKWCKQKQEISHSKNYYFYNINVFRSFASREEFSDYLHS